MAGEVKKPITEPKAIEPQLKPSDISRKNQIELNMLGRLRMLSPGDSVSILTPGDETNISLGVGLVKTVSPVSISVEINGQMKRFDTSTGVNEDGTGVVGGWIVPIETTHKPTEYTDYLSGSDK
jgi:hypothetical protein